MQKLRCFARNWCICVCLQPGSGGGSIKFAAKFVGDTCFFAFASVCNKFEGFKQLLSFLRSLCNLAWAQWLWKSKCCIQGPLELALISKVRVRVVLVSVFDHCFELFRLNALGSNVYGKHVSVIRPSSVPYHLMTPAKIFFRRCFCKKFFSEKFFLEKFISGEILPNNILDFHICHVYKSNLLIRT